MIEHAAAASVPIELEPVAESQVVSGAPSTGFVVLGDYAGQEYGVWEMTPGAMTDVEADELFTVISGAATVDLVADATSITLSPGSVVALKAGMETVWTVTETLRKVYVTPLD
jgi:hypothetical protein